MEKQLIYLSFHIGKGEKDVKQTHLKLLGFYDFQWVIEQVKNDGKAFADGSKLISKTGRVLLKGEDALNAKTGILNINGVYDTYYTKKLEELCENEKDAIKRAFVERAGVSSFEELLPEITDYLTEYEGIDKYESDDGRFVLYPSKRKEGFWACADTHQGIVCVFKEHHFFDDKQTTALFNSTDLTKKQEYQSEMQEWLEANHFNKMH